MTQNGSDNFSVISLQELNDEEAKQYLGGTVFVGLLMVIGVIGNLNVIYVYALKLRPCNLRVFILCLGFVDILTCSIGMPFVVYDLTHPLMFFARFVCKALRFLNYFNSSSSALILMLVSIERYRKICVPMGRQLTERSSKICCGLVLVLALLMSWPAPLLYGQSSVPTKYENVTGSKCYTEDRFKDTPYQAYFNIFLIFIFIITSFVLVVLYVLVAKEIFRHHKFRSKYIRKIKYRSKSSKTIKDNENAENTNCQKSRNDLQVYIESESDTATKSSDVSNCYDSKRHLQNNSVELYQIKQTENGVKDNISDKGFQKETIDEEQYKGNADNHDFDNKVQSETNSELKEMVSEKLDSYTHQEAFEHKHESRLTAGGKNYIFRKGQEWANLVANETFHENMAQSSTSSHGNLPFHDTNSNPFARTTEHSGLVNPSFVISTSQSDIETFQEVNKSSAEYGTSFNKTNTAPIFSSSSSGGTADNGKSRPHLEQCAVNMIMPTPVISGLKTNIKEAINRETKGKARINRHKSDFDRTKEESDQAKRITLILFMITLVYFCSFLPHLVLKILVFLKKDFLSNLSFSEAFAYHTFVWSFFINNVANPFIYGFCDQKFREELKSLYCKCRR